MPAKASRMPQSSGFDITPAAKPRPTGLSKQQKAMLALGLVAVLGTVAFVADWLTAKDGYTPSKGYEKVEDVGAPAHADPGPGAALVPENGTSPQLPPAPETLANT